MNVECPVGGSPYEARRHFTILLKGLASIGCGSPAAMRKQRVREPFSRQIRSCCQGFPLLPASTRVRPLSPPGFGTKRSCGTQ
jgi:hypothetical protein